jgi:ankyrin repeat protein
MHLACSKNHIEIVQYLKKIGANFNIRNDYDKLPVDLTKDNEIIRLIVNHDSTF